MDTLAAWISLPSGEDYLSSPAPFEGQDSGRKITIFRRGESRVITPGLAAVLVGGRLYSTVACGDSNPAALQPGESALVTLLDGGSSRRFARWEVIRLPRTGMTLDEAQYWALEEERRQEAARESALRDQADREEAERNARLLPALERELFGSSADE
jgi:hypothetical protein